MRVTKKNFTLSIEAKIKLFPPNKNLYNVQETEEKSWNSKINVDLIFNKFIRWFHKFSVTTNLRIFQETEFVYLFLCTVNVNT